MGDLKAGTKLRCAGCGTEVIVVRPPADTPTCCGEPMHGPEAAS